MISSCALEGCAEARKSQARRTSLSTNELGSKPLLCRFRAHLNPAVTRATTSLRPKGASRRVETTRLRADRNVSLRRGQGPVCIHVLFQLMQLNRIVQSNRPAALAGATRSF